MHKTGAAAMYSMRRSTSQRLRPSLDWTVAAVAQLACGVFERYLEVDFIHHLMVGLELIKLNFEIRRRQHVRQYHWIEVHGLFVAPQGQYISMFSHCRLAYGLRC